MDLFADQHRRKSQTPLAARMRPATLDDYIGQRHIVGPGRLLRRAIQADQISSVIFYGPPGTGKTTLARIIANTTEAHFISINAVLAGVKEMRKAIDEAKQRRDLYQQRTILFVDEVHRWNKAQQDALLPWVEGGTIILIGATTENPYFEVIKPLVSRSRIFQLKPLEKEDLLEIARLSLIDRERGYGQLEVKFAENALAHLVDVAGGDARSLLNAMELAIETTEPGIDGIVYIDMEVAEESIQQRALLYDKEGDAHYDTISAFIKSLRGSDPDAALYWMARMVYAGEDPKFIFRRMLILAGEDVGLADPGAISIVAACAQAFDYVGMPEGRYHLAHAALYLATAPKSNSAMAFFDALSTVGKEQESEMPNSLRDNNQDAEGLGHGAGYLYPHAYRDHWIAQQYLPDSLQGRVFYKPSDQGYEKSIKERVVRRREAQLAAMVEGEAIALPEILTFTGKQAARERELWLARTISGTGEFLARIRDQVLKAADLRRHYLALDLNASSGLFTWELSRRVPEGGVWSLFFSEKERAAFCLQAEELPEIERPNALFGNIASLPLLIEEGMRFDAIIGRNPFTRRENRETAGKSLAKILHPKAIVSIAQAIPKYTQRLYRLPDLTALGKDLEQRVIAAEEGIYESGDMVNWDEEDLKSMLGDNFDEINTKLEKQTTQMYITSAMIDHWFAKRGKSERPSYGQHLRSCLDEDEIDRVKKLFAGQLGSRTVSWTLSFACLIARK